MSNKIEQIISIIGCDRNEFIELISSHNQERISITNDYWGDFNIFSGCELIAKYDTKGNLIK